MKNKRELLSKHYSYLNQQQEINMLLCKHGASMNFEEVTIYKSRLKVLKKKIQTLENELKKLGVDVEE